MLKTFEQIKREVLALPLNEDEICRISTEIALFNDRGWNDYIALAINIINEVENNVKIYAGGTEQSDDMTMLCFKYLNKSFFG